MAQSKLKPEEFVAYQAPDFTAAISADETVRLADLKGHWAVLYFYPKDDTESCTNEAKAFSELKLSSMRWAQSFTAYQKTP